MDYSTIIIGGGIVGLACAMKLTEINKSVLLVERHPSFGYETSSRNSEVIHAGIYYPQDSLKAKLCVAGKWKLYQWCEKHNVPYRKIGKFIVATSTPADIHSKGTEADEERLSDLFRRGNENGVENLEIISKDRIKRAEPYIKATSAIWSPNTGIIDSHSLMQSFVEVARENGCDFAWRHTLTGIEKINGGFSIELLDPENKPCTVSGETVINAAGLDSDLIAEKAGLDIDKFNYRLHWCRGHYFRLPASKKHLAKHLIYPVPPKNSQSLGIHISIEISGDLKLGPDTQYLTERKQEYIVPDILKDKFFRAASLYINGLEFDDLSPDQSGIRPRLQKEGGEFRDFIISEESNKGLPGLINLIGIESPGLTCCIEIGEMITKLLN
jgi:L-2-hydroxyglutarate oxidase LhgO